GSGWRAAAASAFRAEARFQATRLPAVMTSVANRTADPVNPRVFMEKRLRIRGDLLQCGKGSSLLRPVLDVWVTHRSTCRMSAPCFKTVTTAPPWREHGSGGHRLWFSKWSAVRKSSPE